MGRGRKPSPTGLKIALGNPGKRPIRNCVIAPRGIMQCPSHFTDEEKLIWGQSTAASAYGVIKPADQELLITFCQQVAIQRQAMRELMVMAERNRQADGSTSYMTVATERGIVKNPLLTVLDASAKTIRALASELGFSPASRERLTSDDQPPLFGDKWEKFEHSLKQAN